MKHLILSGLFLLQTLLSSAPSAFAVDRIVTADILAGQVSTKNLLGEKGHFEKNVVGWTGYADAAATTPVDMTGGSPTLTCTRTTSTPLSGSGSFLITKDAANRQGNGCSTPFTIDTKMKGKVLQISFDYAIASGTFVDNDIDVWVYDVTNAALIAVAPYHLKNHSLAADRLGMEFQTSSSSVSYRVGFHVASTSASAYTVKIDDMTVGQQAKLYGSPVTDWQTYTPTGTWVTNTTYTGNWRRVGDSMEISASVALTGAPTGNFTLNIPSGYSIDTTKSPASNPAYGIAYGFVAGTTRYSGTVRNNSSTSVQIVGPSTSAAWNATVPATFANGDLVQIYFTVPIVGWSSSAIMSSDAETRVVSLHASRTTSLSLTTGTIADLVFDSSSSAARKEGDTHGAYNTTTGVYTVQVPGWYYINAGADCVVASGTQSATIDVTDTSNNLLTRLSGLNGQTTFTLLMGSRTILLKAGDQFKIRVTITGTTPSVYGDTTSNLTTLDVTRVSGPAQVAASESVNARYYASATSISGSLATVSWTTKDYDSHGAMSAGTYTVPVAGKYQVNSYIANSGTFILNTTLIMEIQKNGTVVSRAKYYAGGAVTQLEGGISDAISCLAGDTLRIQISNSGTSPVIVSSNSENWISITRVGN